MNSLESKYAGQMRIRSSSELQSRLRAIKHVALDLDGTIYNGNTLFPFTISFLRNLKALGVGYSFLTNNPSRSIGDYISHLKNLGIPVTRDEIYTSTLATIDYLKKYYPGAKRLFILGTPSMIKEFEDAGYESTEDDPDDKPEVIVVGFDKTLVYSRLCRAAWWISKDIIYMATNPDKVCPTDEPVILVDCGSICSCLEHATGRSPDVVIGKPDPRMLNGIIERHQLEPSQIAMIGDRIYTDLKMAYEAKTLGVLVLTGETIYDVRKHFKLRPDIIVDDLEEFGKMLISSKKLS
jgi:HAD superfamily hydrolase (TIGR01450 family)